MGGKGWKRNGGWKKGKGGLLDVGIGNKNKTYLKSS